MTLQASKDDYSNIKGVLFDFDGTLYHQTPLRIMMMLLLVILNIISPRGLFKKIKVISEYRKAQELLRKRGDTVVLCADKQVEITAANSGESKDYVTKIKEEWFEKKPLRILPFCRRAGLTKVLEVLHRNGFKLGMFSDYPAGEKLRALGISEYFSVVVSAHDKEIKGFKPHTNGFSESAIKMGLKPSQILYVGDRPEVDGLGAVKAGMPVVILAHKNNIKNSRYQRIQSLYNIVELLQVTGPV